MITVPRFCSTDTDPGTWDDLTLLAATIFLEAEGEPDDGKLAVGWVVRNRADQREQTIRQVILGPDAAAYGDGKAFEAFSCWNDDYRPVAATRLAGAGQAREASWRAAMAALWQLLPDPTNGSTFYLNIELTRKIRGGTLPEWATKALAKSPGVVIGRHTFLS